jgi:hypothetical protein
LRPPAGTVVCNFVESILDIDEALSRHLRGECDIYRHRQIALIIKRESLSGAGHLAEAIRQRRTAEGYRPGESARIAIMKFQERLASVIGFPQPATGIESGSRDLDIEVGLGGRRKRRGEDKVPADPDGDCRLGRADGSDLLGMS